MEHAERAVDGLIDPGIRAVFAHGRSHTVRTRDRRQAVPPSAASARADRDVAQGRLSSDDTLVTPAMAILGPDWGSSEVVEHDIKMAREFGLVSSSPTRRREDCVVQDGYARMLTSRPARPRPQPGVRHELRHGRPSRRGDNGGRSPRPCWSNCIITSATPKSRRYANSGRLPSLGIDVELFCSGQMFREMQAALLFRARQGNPQQCRAWQLAY